MPELNQLLQNLRVKPAGIIHIGMLVDEDMDAYYALRANHYLFLSTNPVEWVILNQGAKRLKRQIQIYQHKAVQIPMVFKSSHFVQPPSDPINFQQFNIQKDRLDNILKKHAIPVMECNVLCINHPVTQSPLLNRLIPGAQLLFQSLDVVVMLHPEALEESEGMEDFSYSLEQLGYIKALLPTEENPVVVFMRNAHLETEPVITMSTLGIYGFFGNQVFQYGFLKCYAQKYGFQVQTSSWDGQWLFGHSDPPVSQSLPLITEDYLSTFKSNSAIVANCLRGFQNVEFRGHFQYHTSYYAPYKDYFLSLYQPLPHVEAMVRPAVEKLQGLGNTIVSIHIRLGDYSWYYGGRFIAPNQWYLDWLKSIWHQLDKPVLFIASNELDKVLADFSEFNPVTINDLGIQVPEAPFYPDFYVLMHSDIFATSNSTFSAAAAMLNQRGQLFMRPHFHLHKLIPYNPWDDYVILPPNLEDPPSGKAPS